MESLPKRLAEGDAVAFAELYDACGDRLHHWLTVRLGSREDAADVLQETFLRLARSRKKLSGVADPVAYAFVVARNEAVRWFEREARRTKHRTASAQTLFVEAAGDDASARETAETVAAALAQLDDELREVVELKVYAGMTFAEVACVTGLPQGTVATRYRRAIERLRGLFAKELL